jgi:2-deoxy-D-gluconate 3-dehydrogenase
LELFDLSGRTAFVTGGTKGLGLGLALALRDAGARVAVGSSSARHVEEAAAKLGVKGICIDCGDPDSIDRAFDVVEEWCGGRLDILVNAAGIINRSSAEEESFEDFEHVMRVNCNGAFKCAQRAFKLMRPTSEESVAAAQGGSIINVGSVCARLAYSNITSYNVSKAALHGTWPTSCSDAGNLVVRVRATAVLSRRLR